MSRIVDHTIALMTPGRRVAFSGELTVTNPQDTYRFEIDKPLAITAKLLDLAVDLDLRLFNAGGELVQESAKSGDKIEFISRTLKPGVYFLQMLPGDHMVGGYRLSLGAAGVASPTRVGASSLGGNSMRLEWLDSSDNETSFRIEHVINGAWKKVGWAPPDATTIVVDGLTPATAYQFRVLALSENSIAPAMNLAAATTGSQDTSGWYKIHSVTYSGVGEATWSMVSQNLAIKPEFQDKFVYAGSWEAAVSQVVEGIAKVKKTDAQGTIVEHIFPLGGDFRVGRAGVFHDNEDGVSDPGEIPDNALPDNDNLLVIALEDSYGAIDRDYDDFYWTLNVEKRKVDIELDGLKEETEEKPHEEDPGAFAPINDDFDEGNEDASGNPVADNQPDATAGHRIVATDDDLLSGTIRLWGDETLDGTIPKGIWSVTLPDEVKDKVIIWILRHDTNEWGQVVSGMESLPDYLPQVYEVRLEGIEASAALRDIEIAVAMRETTGSNAESSDKAMATVVGLTYVDARAFQPTMLENGNADLGSKNFRAGDFAESQVQGAITDGSSLVVFKTNLDIPGETFDFVLREQGSGVAGDPWKVGSLSSAGGALPLLPAGDAGITGPEEQAAELSETDGLAYYRPPNNFLLGTGIVEAKAIDVVVTRDGKPLFKKPFLLRRPPLLLVHGLTGTPSTWPEDVWKSNATPLNTVIRKVDYSDRNTKGYEDNFRRLKDTIDGTLEDFRSGETPTSSMLNGKKFAATRVDVAGHSMGGLITKWFIADWGTGTVFSRGEGYDFFGTAKLPQYRYLRDDNYGAGSIRRFFSLGSPFLGSPLGNVAKPLLAGTEDRLVILDAAARVSDRLANLLFVDGNVENYRLPSAIADLAEGSAANMQLAAATYPTGRKAVQWHPLTGIAGVDGAVTTDLLFNLLINFVLERDGEVTTLSPDVSDLVVHRDSQQNGTGFGQTFDHHIHAGPALAGFLPEGGSVVMADWIAQLLTKDPAVTDFQTIE